MGFWNEVLGFEVLGFGGLRFRVRGYKLRVEGCRFCVLQGL